MSNKEQLKLLKEAIKTKATKNIISLFSTLSAEDIQKIDEETGMNIVHYAVSENAYKELFLILAEYKTLDVNIMTKSIQKKTALDIACAKGNVEIVKLLLQNGAQVEDIQNFQKKYKQHKSILNIIEDALGIERKKGFFSFLSN